MFLGMSAHYRFTHEINKRKSSSILPSERQALAKEAYELGCDVVQAVCDVCGTELRQTYLHDIVYGLQKLFILLGKPYLGATEGNEHAHQEMKQDYHHLCNRGGKRKVSDMLQLMNLSHLRREVYRQYGKFAPPTRESERNLSMDMGLGEGKRTCKRHDDAIVIADGHLTALKEAPKEPIPAEKA